MGNSILITSTILQTGDCVKMHNLGNGAATEIGIYQLHDINSFSLPRSPHSSKTAKAS